MRRGFGIICGLASAWSAAFGATGSVLIEYDSSLGTLPHVQGWTCLSNCLNAACPDGAAGAECDYQGGSGNDCTLGHGCGPNAMPALDAEWYNAPSGPLAVTGACTYTEWLAFDDGEDYLDHPYPVPLPLRNLTFGPSYPATTWGPHAHPAFGAPGFVGAPTGHHALRIVTGSGVPVAGVLPAVPGNERNTGYLRVQKAFAVPIGVNKLTLVARLAAGNREATSEMLQFAALGHVFSLGVDGTGSGTTGRFTRGTTASTRMDIFTDRAVEVAMAEAGVFGPHAGEFFTVRVVLGNDGSVRAWLNEDFATTWNGTTGTSAYTFVALHPDQQSGTMWVDYVRLFEGEVLPDACDDPTFDINHDGRIDSLDLTNGTDGFLDCATGSAAPPAVFDALSSRCRCHDGNGDRAIDMADFAMFQRCLTLDNAPIESACDD